MSREVEQMHLALHLAHRWFAFLEAPGGNVAAHLAMFHPQVRLTGHHGGHLFATSHASLVSWLSAVPDEISSHHIIHSNYVPLEHGQGALNMVISYQAPGHAGMHGAIISYETRVEFLPGGPRFTALDKTPMLPNTRSIYASSWSTNRALALVHAELGGLRETNHGLQRMLGVGATLSAHASGREGDRRYEAIITATRNDSGMPVAVELQLSDDPFATFPTIEHMSVLSRELPPGPSEDSSFKS